MRGILSHSRPQIQEEGKGQAELLPEALSHFGVLEHDNRKKVVE